MTRLPGSLTVVLLPCLLTACAGQNRKLTYAQVQALNPGASACWVLAEYPGGRVTRGPDGTPRTVRYTVDDPCGRNETLTLEFDRCGVLTRKAYSGRPVRPATRRAKAAPAAPCPPSQASPSQTPPGGPPITTSCPPTTASRNRQRR